MQWGVYLILEKLRTIAYRTLFKKVFVIQGKNTRIKLSAFQKALEIAKVNACSLWCNVLCLPLLG